MGDEISRDPMVDGEMISHPAAVSNQRRIISDSNGTGGPKSFLNSGVELNVNLYAGLQNEPVRRVDAFGLNCAILPLADGSSLDLTDGTWVQPNGERWYRGEWPLDGNRDGWVTPSEEFVYYAEGTGIHPDPVMEGLMMSLPGLLRGGVFRPSGQTWTGSSGYGVMRNVNGGGLPGFSQDVGFPNVGVNWSGTWTETLGGSSLSPWSSGGTLTCTGL